LARRELRGGVRGLWVVLLCLALGVAVIAAVGSLRAAIDAGLASDGRRILGGDLEVESGSRPLPDTLRDWLRARGAVVSDIVKMRSMLVSPTGERQLIELKAVDSAWPLLGSVNLAPAQSLAHALAERDGAFGLLAEPVILDRLGLKPGDRVRLGAATLRVAGALLTEPDRVASPLLLGPRALISSAALPQTELLAPGAMLRYGIRVVAPSRAAAAPLVAALR
jgi:putative ABC transport system permease protein